MLEAEMNEHLGREKYDREENDKEEKNYRNVYPSTQALYKVLYLSTMSITRNWTSKVPFLGETLRELEILYAGRI